MALAPKNVFDMEVLLNHLLGIVPSTLKPLYKSKTRATLAWRPELMAGLRPPGRSIRRQLFRDPLDSSVNIAHQRHSPLQQH